MLTEERANALKDVLFSDEECAKKLLEIGPAEALTQINAHGYDFTLDELNEFGQALRDIAQNGEICVDALDDVAGGTLTGIAVVGASISAASLGFTIGRAVGGITW